MSEQTLTDRRTNLSPTEALNREWRANKAASDQSVAALDDVVRGEGITSEQRAALVDELVAAIPDSQLLENRETPTTDRVVVERLEDGVMLRIPTRLWREQPLGVLCRPVHHRVNGEGSAIFANVYPFSATVHEETMPTAHVGLRIVPTALWLERRYEQGLPLM